MGRGKGAMRRGRWGGSNRKGRRGRGQRLGGRGGSRGDWISQMDMMKCLGGHMECLGGMRVTEFSDFVYPCNAGYPS